MKKRGARDIPDFSSKKKGVQNPGTPPRQATPSPAPRERVIKPTSAKSGGRRGS